MITPEQCERYWMRYASAVRSLPESASVATRHLAGLESVALQAQHEIVHRLIRDARQEVEQSDYAGTCERAKALHLHLNRLIRLAVDLEAEGPMTDDRDGRYAP